MRVYQFRHIRAERQSSRSRRRQMRRAGRPIWGSAAVKAAHHVTRFSYVSPTMTGLLRGLVICLLCVLALATRRGACRRATGVRRARRGRRRSFTAAARSNPLESRTAAPVAHAHVGAEPRLRARIATTASRGAGPLALQAGRERHGRRRASLAARPAHSAARGGEGLSERPLPNPARPQPAADRRARRSGAPVSRTPARG